TTMLLAIASLVPRTAGRVVYDGQPLVRAQPEELVRKGLVLVPEGRHLFPGLRVVDSLRLGAWTRRLDSSMVRRNLRRAFDVFPVLAERREQLAGTLSSGEQQMLAIARGLMA